MTTAGTTPPTHLLVVEGTSDQHAVLHLCMANQPGFEKTFECHDAKSFQGVLSTVNLYVKQAGMIAVGFVVDADDAPKEHWNQVIDRIESANSAIQLPSFPDPNGTIIPEDPNIFSPRIGIWVMPDNASTGELEDFAAQMIPDSDKVWLPSQRYINQIPHVERKFDDSKVMKSHVHAWLAARRRPGLIGLAVRDGDLNVNNPLSQRFLTWLTNLFC